MSGLPTTRLGRSVAAVLLLVLALADVGRGWAAVPDAAGPLSIAGAAVHICHTGPSGSVPADPDRHDCCDACALLAPATLPVAPTSSEPARIARVADHAVPVPRGTTPARNRTPRQSRGPPAA